jgi:hypothetical protein
MSKMRWFKAVSSCLTLLLCAPGQAWAQPGTGALDSLVATITESHGTVYKRGFVDWKKAEWTDPEPAKLGDALSEGMQLGTKADSWAQVSWPNVIARAWENSVFAVAPNKRLVYLCQGEMLLRLDKHRKDKNNYYIWTKTMQARIHGTTVLVRATPEISEITVLEGSVVLLNRINHSIVNLNPGVVFQINNHTGQAVFPPNTGSTAQPGASPAPTIQSAPQDPAQSPKANDHPAGAHAPDQSNTASPSAAPPSTGKDTGQLHLMDISSNHKPMELFKTEAETSSVKHVSSEKILSHPLVSQFENKLDSVPLIKDAMSKLPAECRTDGAPVATTNGANNSSGIANDSTVSNTSSGAPIQAANNTGDNSNQATSTANGHSLQATGFQITQVPTSTKYEIGSGALQQLSLPPGCLREFPPSGLIAAGTNSADTAFQQTDKSTSQSQSLNNVAVETLGTHNLNNTASDNLANSSAVATQGLNNIVSQNLAGVATANVVSSANQNLSGISTQNLTGFAALNLNNTLTQNLATGVTQTLNSISSVNLVNTTSINSDNSINCMNSCPNLVTAIDSCPLNTNVCADAGP